jgi:ESCRT-I complex subunit TSG101
MWKFKQKKKSQRSITFQKNCLLRE